MALVFAGCVTMGTPFKWDAARRIQPGMTKAQVTAIMGQPYVRTAEGDAEGWAWVWGSSTGAAGSFKILLKDGVVTAVPKIPGDM